MTEKLELQRQQADEESPDAPKSPIMLKEFNGSLQAIQDDASVLILEGYKLQHVHFLQFLPNGYYKVAMAFVYPWENM